MSQRSARTGWASAATARHYDRQLVLERGALTAGAALAAPGPGELLVDLATGTGAMLRTVAARPAPPRTAVGIDASPAMLARVGPLPNGWRLIEADVRRIPLPDASVDVVSCCYLLHLLGGADRAAVLGEIARVLRPGGRSVIVTLLLPRGLLGGALLAPAQRAVARALGPASGWRAHDPRAELPAAGLRLVRARVLTRGYASLCLLAERA